MSRKDKKKSVPARAFRLFVKIAVIAVVLIAGVNIYVVKSTEGQITAALQSRDAEAAAEEVSALKSIDPECIMVLGASVRADGTPSAMLRDRLDAAVELYEKGVAPKILLSGDNGQMTYNEVQGMKDYVLGEGVAEEDVFLDHAGFSTYESVYRARYIFDVESMIVVTQTYHLYRALYGCNRFGIKAMGVASDQASYRGQIKRDIREVLARDKDFVMWMFKPEPTFLGEKIPLAQ